MRYHYHHYHHHQSPPNHQRESYKSQNVNLPPSQRKRIICYPRTQKNTKLSFVFLYPRITFLPSNHGIWYERYTGSGTPKEINPFNTYPMIYLLIYWRRESRIRLPDALTLTYSTGHTIPYHTIPYHNRITEILPTAQHSTVLHV